MVDQEFLTDFERLIMGQAVAHMGRHLYADHKGKRGNQSMSGSKCWIKLADDEPSYPISRGDIELFNDELDNVAERIPEGMTLYDLGPGGKKSLKTKSMKLIQAAGIKRYRPVDSSEAYTKAAVEVAKRQFPGLDVEPCLADVLQGAKEEIVEPSLAYFGGGTIGNIIHPVSKKFPQEALEQILKNLTSYAPQGWLFISFDGTRNRTAALNRYSSKANDDFACNVMYRAAAKPPISGFDPNKFKSTRIWIAESHQVAHMLVATDNQDFVLNGKNIHVRKGQKFHFVNSYKPSPEMFERAVGKIGYIVEHHANNASGMELYLLRSPFAPAANANLLKAAA